MDINKEYIKEINALLNKNLKESYTKNQKDLDNIKKLDDYFNSKRFKVNLDFLVDRATEEYYFWKRKIRELKEESKD